MRERGILFSAPMVRAILAGRKTQTRRAVKFTENGYLKEPASHRRWHRDDPEARNACPYGVPGDRLWVREAWQQVYFGPPDEAGYVDGWEGAEIPDPARRDLIQYRATGDWPDHYDDRGFNWRPSLLMPRWASRITLEVTVVRVERAQDISDADVAAEGVDAEAVQALHRGATAKQRRHAFGDEHTVTGLTPFGRWRSAWTLINGRESWDANPWVWVIEFRRLT